MAIFRGAPADKPRQPEPPPEPESYQPELVAAPRPTGLEEARERALLDNHRQRADQEPANYYQPDEFEERANNADRRPVLNFIRERTIGAARKKADEKFVSPTAKRALVAIGMFLMPTIIGLLLMLLAIQAGGQLEHINRITNNIRFAGLHGEIRARSFHVAAVANEEIAKGTAAGNNLNRFSRTSLIRRALTMGWSRSGALKSLTEAGFELDIRTGWGARGYGEYLYGVHDTLGEFSGSRSPNDPDFVDVAERRLRTEGRGFRNALHIRQTVRHLQEITRWPWARFRGLIRDLGQSRALTPAAVRVAVNDNIIKTKKRLLARVNRPKSAIPGVEESVGGVHDDIRTGALQDSASIKDSLRSRLKKRLGGIRPPTGVVGLFQSLGVGAAVAEFLTYSCIFSDTADQIKHGFRSRIADSQDAATTIITSTSQIKSGETNLQVVSDLSKRFEGFENSAVYHSLVANKPLQQAQEAGFNFSPNFDNTRMFGVPVGKITGVLEALGKPADLVTKIVPWLECHHILNQKFQLTVLAIEAALLLKAAAAAVLAAPGGPAASTAAAAASAATDVAAAKAASLAVREASKRSVLKIAQKGVLVGVAIGFDYFVFDFLIPKITDNISGVEFTLITPETSTQQVSRSAPTLFGLDLFGGLFGRASAQSAENEHLVRGAQNFATVDYGMHYLKEQQGLLEGGSRRRVGDEVKLVTGRMDDHRSQFAKKGLFNNLFALDNPYSLASTLMIKSPGGLKEASQQVGSLLPNLLSLDLFGGLFGRASAQSISDEDLANLLYPGQTHVIGFSEDQIRGIGGFDFMENSAFVEANLDRLRDAHAACLTVDVADFMLWQVGIDNEYDPGCDSEEAQRYKLYYNDCVNIDQAAAEDLGRSSLFSTACQHLLPESSL